jgi:hypothetical protein
MKLLLKSIGLAGALLCLAGNAWGGTDKIGVYMDESASTCNLVDVGTDVHQVFVVYTGTTGLTASEFQLVPEDGAGLTYLGGSIPQDVAGAMGRADTGIGVALGWCFEGGTRTILAVLYQGLGASEFCSQLSIRSHPESVHQNGDKIVFVTCGEQIAWADPSHLTVNPDDDCECEVDPQDLPSPVLSTTWGGIKALYVD